jgi:hypothetical protein
MDKGISRKTGSSKPFQKDPPKIEGKYYRGRIAKFNPTTGYGFVEAQKGTHIFFYADQVRMEGDHAFTNHTSARDKWSGSTWGGPNGGSGSAR